MASPKRITTCRFIQESSIQRTTIPKVSLSDILGVLINIDINKCGGRQKMSSSHFQMTINNVIANTQELLMASIHKR